MVITELIRTQVFETSVMLGAGLALGVLCSLFFYIKSALPAREPEERAGSLPLEGKGDRLRWMRCAETHPRGHFVFGALEIAFWVLAALFVTKFLEYSSHGALSFHNFLAMTLGVLLWQKLFYGRIKS